MYKEFLSQAISDLRTSGSYRVFTEVNRRCNNYPAADLNEVRSGRVVDIWCSNDYLGMSQNPSVVNALCAAALSHGAGAGGSRNIGGTHSYLVELEEEIADWLVKPQALVFPTGFSSNDASLQCLSRLLPNVVFFSDEKNHASIINGLRAGQAKRQVFRHNDLGHLEQLLAAAPAGVPKVIVFESVYSMDGDVADIAGTVALAKRYQALTFLDEVHAIGMYGPQGRGKAAELGVDSEVDIIQGTMAKSIGVIGGFIAGQDWLVDAIRSYAPGFIFTTALPPAIAAAALSSIRHLRGSERERVQLAEKTQLLRNLLAARGIPVLPESTTHILPVLVGDARLCTEAAKHLLDHYGIYLQPINSPTVPQGTERFRVNVTPAHSEAAIREFVASLSDTFDVFELARNKEGVLV